jgi:hypothetical protein
MHTQITEVIFSIFCSWFSCMLFFWRLMYKLWTKLFLEQSKDKNKMFITWGFIVTKTSVRPLHSASFQWNSHICKNYYSNQVHFYRPTRRRPRGGEHLSGCFVPDGCVIFYYFYICLFKVKSLKFSPTRSVSEVKAIRLKSENITWFDFGRTS